MKSFKQYLQEFQPTGLPSPPGASVPAAKVAWDKRNTRAEDRLTGTWDETETDLTVTINGKTDTISTVDRNGTPRPGDLIRIRVQMERLLRKMGVDVEAPGKQGDYDVKVIFPERKPKDGPFPETGKFRLTPRPVNAAFMRDPISVR